MGATIQNSYHFINEVVFAQPAYVDVEEWMNSYLFNPEATHAEVNSFAQAVLLNRHASHILTSKKRYKFCQITSKDELLKTTFDHAFSNGPNKTIRLAERVAGVNFYPRWKEVCWRDIPKGIELVFGGIPAKVVFSIAAFYYSFGLARRARHHVAHFCTARALPFFINNTPSQIIRAGNGVLAVRDWMSAHAIVLFVSAWAIGRQVRREPQIPYVTAAISGCCNAIEIVLFVSEWAIGRQVRRGPQIPYVTAAISGCCNAIQIVLRSPQTFFWFIVKNAFSAGVFVWQNCNIVSRFCHEIAARTENERLSVCKEKAYAVWLKAINDNTPQRRARV